MELRLYAILTNAWNDWHSIITLLWGLVSDFHVEKKRKMDELFLIWTLAKECDEPRRFFF